ncbi:MAG: DNA recombination protein RmuC, partial [Dehalococcoidia bacterium]
MAVLAVILLLVVVIVLGYFVIRRLEGLEDKVAGGLNTMTQTMGSSQATIERVGRELGEISASTRQMLEIGQDISGLQDILRPPKLRGGFGELLLERLLAQILPSANYRAQYRFRTGEQVDAVVDLGTGLVPVDSKFPMESFTRLLAAQSEEERRALRREFERAVRGHVDAVTKYIRPDEGTFDFALMYIPAENVYYEINIGPQLDGGSLATYALERRVIPVSPSCFYAYLQAIVLGLKGMHVEERAREIIDHLAQLNNEFGSFRR